MRELKQSELNHVSGGELPFITEAKKWFNDLIDSSRLNNIQNGFSVAKFFAGAVLDITNFLLKPFIRSKS